MTDYDSLSRAQARFGQLLDVLEKRYPDLYEDSETSLLVSVIDDLLTDAANE